jgi:hypothetical protein
MSATLLSQSMTEILTVDTVFEVPKNRPAKKMTTTVASTDIVCFQNTNLNNCI